MAETDPDTRSACMDWQSQDMDWSRGLGLVALHHQIIQLRLSNELPVINYLGHSFVFDGELP